MPSFPLFVRPAFRMVIVLPFRLGADFVPLAAARRQAAFPAAAARLEQSLPAFAWQSVPFDETNKVPDLLEQRKGCFLLGRCKQSALAGVGAAAEYPRAAFGPPAVRESVWYYDWGLGAVELEVDLPWDLSKTSSALAQVDLLKFGNFLAYQNESRLTFFGDWATCSARLTEALRQAGHAARVWGGADTAFTGHLAYAGLTLTLYSTAAAGPNKLELPETVWKGLLSGFTGKAAEAQSPVHWPGVLAVGEGQGGLIALLDGTHPELDQVRGRVTWLWRLVTLYLANLDNARRALGQQTLDLLASAADPNPDEMEKLGRERLGLELLLQECSPASICTMPLSGRVYGEIWKSWEGDLHGREVKEHLELLRRHFQESVGLLSTRLQERVNRILVLLNVVAFASGLATLIATYDYLNDKFSAGARLDIIIVGTGVFAVATLGLYLTGRFIRKRTRGGGPL